MAAYFDCGFSVREPAWHGLAVVLDDYPTSWEEARILAGLDWEPELVGLLDEEAMTTVEGFKLIRRDDNHAPLAVRSDEFALVTHADMGVIMDAIMGDSAVKFETAGVLRGGRSVWALARIDEPYVIPGDDSAMYPFVAIINHHDGTGACRLTNSQVRIVCWNTVQANVADAENTGRQFVFRHAGDVLGRIEEAKAALAGARREATEYAEMATELTKLNVTDTTVKKFLSEWMPTPPDGLVSDRVMENHERDLSLFRSILFGPTVIPHEHTAYGLLLAATEYADHVRGFQNRDTYLTRTMLRPEPLKHKAMNIIRRVVK